MLLVEQGVLWVLPMLWLVLLLSEEAGQPPPPRAPACRGDLGAGVEVRAPARAPHHPRDCTGLPQVVMEGT